MNIKIIFKRIFDPLIKVSVSNKISWSFFHFLIKFTEWVKFHRSKFERNSAENNLRSWFSDMTVKSGYFKRLKYNSFTSSGSSLFPKLLGSYESELHPVFLKFEVNNYEHIIDIGCAEGFYVVGMAIKYPNAKIHGFDINENALRLCYELAKANNVDDKITLAEKCDDLTLGNYPFSGRSLIICDVEGFERFLFTPTNIENLKNVDLIIELHPFIEEDVKEYLIGTFSNSHKINMISSFDNNRKIFDSSKILQKLNKTEQLLCVEEGRPFTMEWLIAESKTFLKSKK